MKGFDVAYDCSKYAARLAGIGYQWGGRYLAGDGDWRHFSRAEAEAMSRAGLMIASIFEGGSGDKFSAELGKSHAARAAILSAELGQPDGSAIYFAVDTDRVKPSDVIPHFEAVALEIPQYDIGVYGPGSICAALLEAGLVRWTWLASSTAWPGYKEFKPRASIVQGLPIHPLAPDPLAIDPDESQVDDFGAWST